MPTEKFGWYAIKLTAICVIIYILQINFPIVNSLTLVSSKSLFHPWTFVSYIFLHGSLQHLFYNMFALILFGSILEKIIGYKKFLLIFFFSGIISGIGSVFFYHSIIGASGAIFGIIGTLGMIRPKMVVWVLGIPMYMIIALIIWAALDFGGIFYPDQIAHIGHLAGLAAGIIAGLKLRSKYKFFEEKKQKEKIINKEELDRWEKEYIKKK